MDVHWRFTTDGQASATPSRANNETRSISQADGVWTGLSAGVLHASGLILSRSTPNPRSKGVLPIERLTSGPRNVYNVLQKSSSAASAHEPVSAMTGHVEDHSTEVAVRSHHAHRLASNSASHEDSAPASSGKTRCVITACPSISALGQAQAIPSSIRSRS